MEKNTKTKVYILIYRDPWEECECGIGIEGYPEILSIRFSKEKAEEYLKERIKKGAKYLEGNTEIKEMEVE